MIKENRSFKILSDEINMQFVNDLFKELNLRKKTILEFFKLKKIRKIEVLLFNNKTDFIKEIAQYYNSVAEIPSYCKANICNGKIHILYDENLKKDEYRYKLKIRNVIHEYIHIIYNEYICSDKRIVWLDEGLAINLSNERAYLNNEEKFNKFLTEVKPKLGKVNLKELEHGEKFVNDKYNGYDISYLVVKYLIEKNSNEKLNLLIRDNEQINNLEDKIINDIIEYFKI